MNKRILWICLSLSLGLGVNQGLLAQRAQAAAQPSIKENPTVRLTPPDQFEVAAQFDGYIHPGTATTILIQELADTHFQLIRTGLTPEYFASQQLQLLQEEEVTTQSGLGGVLYTVRFTVDEVDFERQMLFAGDYQRTAWIVANYPVLVRQEMAPVIRNSLLSVGW